MPFSKQRLIMKKISAYLIALLSAGACFVACDDDDDDPIDRGLYDATPAKSAEGVYSGTCLKEPIGTKDSTPSTEQCEIHISPIEDNPYAAAVEIYVDGEDDCPWKYNMNIVHTAAGFDLTDIITSNGNGQGFSFYINPNGEGTSTLVKTLFIWNEIEDPFTGGITYESQPVNTQLTFTITKDK